MIEGAGPTGHLNKLGHEPSNYTVVYVGVDDIKSYIAKAEGLGAKTLVGPIAIPTGQFAWLSDPTGTTIGLWQAAWRNRTAVAHGTPASGSPPPAATGCYVACRSR
jgi:predicted enzyme related to lactoylglutathione lyase